MESSTTYISLLKKLHADQPKDGDIKAHIEKRKVVDTKDKEQLKDVSKKRRKNIGDNDRMERHGRRIHLSHMASEEDEIEAREEALQTLSRSATAIFIEQRRGKASEVNRNESHVTTFLNSLNKNYKLRMIASRKERLADTKGIKAEDLKGSDEETKEMSRSIFNGIIKQESVAPKSWKKCRRKSSRKRWCDKAGHLLFDLNTVDVVQSVLDTALQQTFQKARQVPKRLPDNRPSADIQTARSKK